VLAARPTGLTPWWYENRWGVAVSPIIHQRLLLLAGEIAAALPSVSALEAVTLLNSNPWIFLGQPSQEIDEPHG
jgi:hypothetical protein